MAVIREDEGERKSEERGEVSERNPREAKTNKQGNKLLFKANRDEGHL